MHSEELPYAVAYAPSMTLREMMETYGSDVWHYAFFLTRSREQANDISQEVFLKAYRSIGKYRGNASLKTWLLTITRNTAFSWRRSSFWRRFAPLGNEQDMRQAMSAEKEAISNQYVSRIWELIMELPDKHREVLVLEIQQGLSTTEMALLLGVAEGTVKSRLSRARDKVRKALEEEEKR
ncbi:RNA polymerase sigma factor YlaC [Paenibacillus auburnensis]|uniref:RNA polymerase sigma factor YlaC n=1 Tax=Paenibacillus auburnensis TaxID=2905649 RepID=A0ABM9BYN4_9BACL|nr:RNA polymerase sigma factor [Paenibacillus auburnensis]CAH1196635.1 RNA polymerase sigma factor YlaC [Paenibacillus auburnensis]